MQFTKSFTDPGGPFRLSIPAGVPEFSFDIGGGSGGSNGIMDGNRGGFGGQMTGLIPVAIGGQDFNIFVGGKGGDNLGSSGGSPGLGGFAIAGRGGSGTGGGGSGGGGGGNLSAITTLTALPLAVAGGAGGEGGTVNGFGNPPGGNGGSGGAGATAGQNVGSATGGQPGTFPPPTGGMKGTLNGGNGSAGGNGGNGGVTGGPGSTGGGGGGAGLGGGGGGGANSSSQSAGGGGGGGSNAFDPSITVLTNTTLPSAGDGYVMIRYTSPSPLPPPTSPEIRVTVPRKSRTCENIPISATLIGGNNPTGSLSFLLFRGRQCCSLFSEETIVLATNQTLVRIILPGLHQGHYSLQVIYSGDINNSPSQSSCTPFKVKKIHCKRVCKYKSKTCC